MSRLSRNELHKKIETCIVKKDKLKIFTPNTEILTNAQKDKALVQMLNSADICIADGAGLIIGAKILGTPLPERLAGIELGEHLLYLASKHCLSIFLLGGKEGVAQKAKISLEKKFRNINICGTHNGYFSSEENDKIIKQINEKGPDIIFVCMGFPRQEYWISKNLDSLPSIKIAIGLGGSLDVWSGNLKRAPRIFRTLSLEWLWRIILEPRRISFVFKIPRFFINILKQKHSNQVKKERFDGKNAHL